MLVTLSLECFDSRTASKQPGREGGKVDILCMLLKTVYFSLFCLIVTLATTFLSSVTVKNVPERMLIKGKIQGKRLYKFFS